MSVKNYYRKFYRNLIFRLSANNSWIFRVFYTHLYSPKKGSLAYFYNRLSKAHKNIFVIQVGANDGITRDPIHKYVKRDRWRGLLIEPQIDVFRNRLFPIYLKDEGIMMENIAIAPENGLMDMYRISFCKERWATGLSTFDKKTLKGKVASGEIDNTAKHNKVKTPARKEDYIESFKVECKSFDFLREKYAIKEVDVLQIDAEGFDFEVVKLYDLSKNKPNVVVFESFHLPKNEYADTEAYFISHGYTLQKISRDSLAVRSDFALGQAILKEMRN
ncbi:FkbM family methyltransferase [Cytophagales bacterium LB-30]|uniref:FkbM family methyltransferase n=1 Tax=Shiella aurantiaca TaxID=3058365 RepID=A0ABT8F0X4_9BACT|nr:FkbM family methyltransferase [Shiella aurantiaca]MDN4164100.1 FkbM family methyltransferase [Shiella aurantiaca]